MKTKKELWIEDGNAQFSQGIKAFLIILLLLLTIALCSSPSKDNKTSTQPTSPQEIKESITPVFQESVFDWGGKKYLYSYAYSEEKNAYAVLFIDNPLPRNDAVMIGATLELLNKIYGKHLLTDLTPKIVPRKNGNVLQFEGEKYNYSFLIFKEDDGRINGFAMWREIK